MKMPFRIRRYLVFFVGLCLLGAFCYFVTCRISPSVNNSCSELSREIEPPGESPYPRDKRLKKSPPMERLMIRGSPEIREVDPKDPFASLEGLSGLELRDAKIELIQLLAEKGDQRILIPLLNYLMGNESEEICYHGAISCIPKLFARERDFVQASAWIKTLGDTPVSGRYLSVAASMLGSFSRNNDAFFDLLNSSGRSEAWRSIVISSYSLAKAEHDPITALNLYFENAKNADVNVMDNIIGRIHGKERVMEFLDAIKGWPDSKYKVKAEGSAFEAWAQKTPLEAADAAKDLSPNSLERVMGVWAAADLKGALRWLQSQPSGQAQDHAILGLFSELKATDPARAVSLALSLENEDLRRSQTELMFRHWRNCDPAAAQEWASHNEYDPP